MDRRTEEQIDPLIKMTDPVLNFTLDLKLIWLTDAAAWLLYISYFGALCPYSDWSHSIGSRHKVDDDDDDDDDDNDDDDDDDDDDNDYDDNNDYGNDDDDDNNDDDDDNDDNDDDDDYRILVW